jgi:toxin HigB-1
LLVKFAFKYRKLERLYLEGKHTGEYPPEVFERFLLIIQLIAEIPDERTLYTQKALHMEKLRGDRAGQHSLRLNKQYRLCFEILQDKDGNIIFILEIADYH